VSVEGRGGGETISLRSEHMGTLSRKTLENWTSLKTCKNGGGGKDPHNIKKKVETARVTDGTRSTI